MHSNILQHARERDSFPAIRSDTTHTFFPCAMLYAGV